MLRNVTSSLANGGLEELREYLEAWKTRQLSSLISGPQTPQERDRAVEQIRGAQAFTDYVGVEIENFRREHQR